MKASFKYPLLTRVAKLYEEVGLEDVLLLASQHLLKPQERMINLLLRAGLKPENCIVAGKNYSTNRGVMHRLMARGCVVAPFSCDFQPTQYFDEWFRDNLTNFIKEQVAGRNLRKYRKIVVLDDGGFMHLVVDQLFGDERGIFGIEQTSSGHHMITEHPVRFETYSVARCWHKLTLEAPHIGRDAGERVVRHLKARGKKNPKILVMGIGPIGRQVAGQAFLVRKYRGCATDIDLSVDQILKSRIPQLLECDDRILSLVEAKERIGEFDVIVGAAGTPVLAEDDVERLHPEVSLISVSSSDREFPVLAFRRQDGKVHEDYYRGRKCLVNGGFPITFDGRPCAISPELIEFTIALLTVRIFDEVTGRGLHWVPTVVEQLRVMWQSGLAGDY